MEAWCGRVALVTGAETAAGLRVTECLLKAGLVVVAVAPDCLALKSLRLLGGQRLYVREAHPEEEEEQVEALLWAQRLGRLQLLVFANQPFQTRDASSILETPVSVWRSALDAIIVRATLAKEATALVAEATNTEEGSLVIVHVHGSEERDAIGAVASATDRALCETIREEIDVRRLRVHVATLSLGAVEESEDSALEVVDIEEALYLILTAPLEAEVLDLTIRRTNI